MSTTTHVEWNGRILVHPPERGSRLLFIAKHSPPVQRFRPSVERLEDRHVPATLSVPLQVMPRVRLITSEAGGKASAMVRLTIPPKRDVAIALETSDASEGIAVPRSLRFTPRNWHVPRKITVVGRDDPWTDADVGYNIRLNLRSSDRRFHKRTVLLSARNRNNDTYRRGGTIVSAARRDANGFLIHQVQSPYQESSTQIRVLMPSYVARGKKYPVVFVLPVEAGVGTAYGDGLIEAKRLNLANRHRAVFVAPTFASVPWYADHPSLARLRQESYFLKIVLPWVDEHYPTKAEMAGRYLVGFSKSGWGAWSLLLRNPHLFLKAAAWDAPLMMNQGTEYGSAAIFGSFANFARYQLTNRLPRAVSRFRAEPRLVLMGYSGFAVHTVAMHTYLDSIGIPHVYRFGPNRPHVWHSGWLADAVALLAPT